MGLLSEANLVRHLVSVVYGEPHARCQPALTPLAPTLQAGGRHPEEYTKSPPARVRLEWMAKPRTAKGKNGAITKILPTQLRVGDRQVVESGEWQVPARPYATAAGKSVEFRFQRVDNPNVQAISMWGAHERVSVRRASAEEGKR